MNESRWGIYACFFMGQVEFHSSYHTDGTSHLRSQGVQAGPSVMNDPINEVRGVAQVVHASISLGLPELDLPDVYDGDKRTESVVVLHDHLFSDEQSRFWLDVWVFDRASEADFYKNVCSTRHGGLSRVVDMATNLDHFPNHKVGISIRSRKN